MKKTRLKEKLTKLKSEMAKLEAIENQVLAAPDQQISLTDPDSRSMATSGRGSERGLCEGSLLSPSLAGWWVHFGV